MIVNGNCYYINRDRLNINDAKKSCQTAFSSKFVGRLYEPKDRATHESVINAANEAMGFGGWLWLGINDKSSKGQFQYFTTGGNLLFAKWKTGQYFHL